MKTLGDYWRSRGYTLESFPFSEAESGDLLLDVGCGAGRQMQRAFQKGAKAFGIDPDFESLRKCRERDLEVIRSKAERLPFKDASFHRLICKGVLDFTEVGSAISEMSRVLRPGGRMQLQVFGLGYYLHYMFFSPIFLTRVYAFLTILNTWIYRMTGRRWRTTVYQSRKRMMRSFALVDLVVLTLTPSKKFLGLPVTFYFGLMKNPASDHHVDPPPVEQQKG